MKSFIKSSGLLFITLFSVFILLFGVIIATTHPKNNFPRTLSVEAAIDKIENSEYAEFYHPYVIKIIKEEKILADAIYENLNKSFTFPSKVYSLIKQQKQNNKYQDLDFNKIMIKYRIDERTLGELIEFYGYAFRDNIK